MLSSDDKSRIQQIAEKYNVGKLYIFGSSIQSVRMPNDIDLAVDGVQDEMFFKFYGELILNLSKPVDVVNLKVESKFNDIIKQKGVLVYERIE